MMNKKNLILKITLICFFLLISAFILFFTEKVNLIFILCILELFLISLTIFCFSMLQNYKDNLIVIYKIRTVFLVIIDFIILLAIIGVLLK